MDTLGRHFLAEYFGCDHELLNDERTLKELLLRAAEAAQVRVVGSIEHSFSPAGVTCVVAIEESHLSLHTWPEEGYAAADFFTCGNGDPSAANALLARGLKAQAVEFLHIERGRRTTARAVRVLKHERLELEDRSV